MWPKGESDVIYADEANYFDFAPIHICKIQRKINKKGVDSLTKKELSDIMAYKLDKDGVIHDTHTIG